MEYVEKAKVLKRICDGKLRFIFNRFSGVLRDLSVFEHASLIDLYNISLKNGLKRGLLSDKEAIELAVRNDIWQEDWNLNVLEKQLTMLKEQMTMCRFQRDRFQAIEIQYNDINNEYIRIKKVYDDIISKGTASAFANKCVAVEHVKTCIILDKQEFLYDLDYIILNNVINDNNVDESIIREIARSSPWITMYRASKDGLGKLFDSIISISFLQKMLIDWSQIYDYVYNSMDKPDDAVINNDSLLDKWLSEQSKKNGMSSKNRRTIGNNRRQSGDTISETFVVADRRGASDVYNMNTSDAQHMVRKSFEKLGVQKDG